MIARLNQDDRKATVGRGGPGGAIRVGQCQDGAARGIGQDQGIGGVREPALNFAGHRQVGPVPGLKRGLRPDQESALARIENLALREGERHTTGQPNTPEVKRRG